MEFETPARLLGRLRLGREEFCQRLLTTLILHDAYPRWNTRSTACAPGKAFLRAVHNLSFGGEWPGDGFVFVDEFELAPRVDTEKGGAPDYAVLWDDHVWLIELKTERASHRHDQIPYYFELAHHHHPRAAIDITYLTPPMTAQYDAPGPWGRFSHLTWDTVTDAISSSWPEGQVPGQQEVIDGLLDTLAKLALTPAEWRATWAVPEWEPVVADPAADALRLAAETAADGRQRALDHCAGDFEELLSLRLTVRDVLASSAPSDPLRHVVPWIWRPESLGQPLTGAGRELGAELRLSRYHQAQY